MRHESCLIYGFFNIGIGYHMRFYRPLLAGDGPVLSPPDPPLDMFTHYQFHISSAEDVLCYLSIRAPSPICNGLIPDNMFAFVVGPILRLR